MRIQRDNSRTTLQYVSLLGSVGALGALEDNAPRVGIAKATAKDQGLHYKRFCQSSARTHTTNQRVTAAAVSEIGEKPSRRSANSESWASGNGHVVQGTAKAALRVTGRPYSLQACVLHEPPPSRASTIRGKSMSRACGCQRRWDRR